MCTTPAWPWPAGSTQASLRQKDTPLRGSSLFSFETSCEGLSFSQAPGNEARELVVSGHGFRGNGMCTFTSPDYAVQSVPLLLTVGSSKAVCTTPLWDPVIGCATFEVCKNNSRLATLSLSIQVKFGHCFAPPG